jgi:hypothetical protein
MLNYLLSFLSGSAFGFSIALYWLYRACRSGRFAFSPPNFPPPFFGVRVKIPRPKPHPGSPSEAQARPEVEGSPLSRIP